MPAALTLLFHAGIATAAALSSQQSIPSGGNTRTFFYYAPDSYDPSQGVMMYLHGGGGNGSSAATQSTDDLWLDLADRVGVFTVFPEGKPRDDDPTSTCLADCKLRECY